MSTTDKAEQAVAFAALILADESIKITPEKLQTLLKAAGIEDVEPIWTTLFAKALKDKDVKDILTTVGPSPGCGAVQTTVEDGADQPDENGDGEDRNEVSDDSDDDGITGFMLWD
jgi:large subunit ribosomal protein LP1